MTRRHLRRRSSRRISALGLVLSLGLVFGASGIISVNAAEQKSPCSEVDEIIESAANRMQAESIAESVPVPHVVHEEGRSEAQRNL